MDRLTHTTISPVEAKRMIDANHLRFHILDVRTIEEFREGHLQGSIHLDFYKDSFRKQLEKHDRHSAYLIYCRTAHRSAVVMSMMREMGFSKVYNLGGGILDWKSKGFPVVEG